ncbi:hypothetical protein CSC81_18310, partial [Tenacibaculum discolor]
RRDVGQRVVDVQTPALVEGGLAIGIGGCARDVGVERRVRKGREVHVLLEHRVADAVVREDLVQTRRDGAQVGGVAGSRVLGDQLGGQAIGLIQAPDLTDLVVKGLRRVLRG